MSEQTLVFNDIKVNRKDFYDSKQAIPLRIVNVSNIVISIITQVNILLAIYMILMRLNLCVLFYHK